MTTPDALPDLRTAVRTGGECVGGRRHSWLDPYSRTCTGCGSSRYQATLAHGAATMAYSGPPGAVLVTEKGLRAAGFDAPDNVCGRCLHHGGDHDLGNWCLVCPRPDAQSSFSGRIDAGWDYFSSMSDDEKWAYGLARLRDTPA